MRDDLQYDLCPGCGEVKPQGFMAAINHSCALNTINYYMRGFSLRKLNSTLAGRDDLQSFKNLLSFEHFKRMSNFDTASTIEKIIYSICRDSEIRTMKRLRAYIELEERFDARW